MKIEGYKGGVGLNTVNAAVKLSGDKMAYGGDGSGLKAIGQAANTWAAVLEKQADEEDRQAILSAMDAYNKGRYNIMYNDESGLMNTVAEGSNGISGSYIEQEKELRNGVLKGIKLHSKRNAIALENLMNKSAQEGFQRVDQHQYRQGEAVKDLRINNNLMNEIEFVQKDPLSLQDSFDRTALMVAARYSSIHGGEALVEARVREAQSQLVGAAIGAAMQQDDTAMAQQIVAQYGHFLTPEQRSSYGKVIKSGIEQNEQFQIGQRLYAQYGDNVAAAYAAIDGMEFGGVEQQLEGTTWVKKSGVSLDGVQDNTKNGLNFIAKTFSDMGGGQLIVTSGTDSTDIHAKGERSHGGGWKLDVAADWLENEENRKAYIAQLEQQGIKVLDEYSNPSANSTGGHLDLDFTDYNGGNTDSLQTYKKREALRNVYDNLLSDRLRREKLTQNKQYIDFSKSVYQWVQQGNVTYEQAIAEARKLGGDNLNAVNSYVSAVNSWYGVYGQSGSAAGGSRRSGNSKEVDLRIDKAKAMLGNGMFQYAQDYVEYISRIPGVSAKDVWDAHQEFDDWYNKRGKYKYDLDGNFQTVVLGKMKDEEKARVWPGLKVYTQQAISDFMIANKREPSMAEVQKIAMDGLTQQRFGNYEDRGKYLFTNEDLKLSRVDMARMNVKNIVNISTTDNEDFYLVYFTDGRPPQYMMGAQIVKMRDGITDTFVPDYGLPEED